MAKQELEANGYEIIECNFYCRFGEIDIIAQKDNFIAFVEVKARSEDCMYAPREAVTFSKQRKICKAAMLYKMRKGFIARPRFDVFEIIYDKYTFEIKKFKFITNAFGTEAVHGFY